MAVQAWFAQVRVEHAVIADIEQRGSAGIRQDQAFCAAPPAIDRKGSNNRAMSFLLRVSFKLLNSGNDFIQPVADRGITGL